jgi:hypothetical protein
LTIASFRFDQAYDELRTVKFLEDLFNNPNVRYLVSAVAFLCDSVTLPQIRCLQHKILEAAVSINYS